MTQKYSQKPLASFQFFQAYAPTAAKMSHLNISRPQKGKCLMPLLLKIGVIMVIMLGKVKSEDQMAAAPKAGLICISDCTTCPVICTPPGPPPPPTFISSHNPSPFEYPSYSPPTASHHSPPPEYYYLPPPILLSPPPAPPKLTHPPPPQVQSPSWYPYPLWGNNPPPPNYYYNTPMGQGPPTPGQHPYPNPYYYFSASKASSLSSITLPFSLMLLFLCGLYLSW